CYSSFAHRALHSFPTRRSSDLVSNVDFPDAGMLEGVSFDGGKTWTTKLIGSGDNLGDACCDPSLSFDQYGNLFLTYLFNVENTLDRKSTRLNSSHVSISYAVFC